MHTQEKATKFLLNIYFRGNDHLSNAVNRAYRDMNRTTISTRFTTCTYSRQDKRTPT